MLIMKALLIIVVISSIYSQAAAEYDGRIRLFTNKDLVKTPKPTKQLKEIFLGRCFYYYNVLYLDNEDYSPKNCTLLWELFFESFSGYDECSMEATHYEKYIDAAYTPVPKDGGIFWQGLQVFMQEFSNEGKRFSAIANTFLGYTISNCRWCGSPSAVPPSSPAESCTFKWEENCNEHSFWVAASIKYAKEAVGNVTLFLDGERFPVYDNRSIFPRWELKYLQPPKNKHVKVMLVLPVGKRPSERCDQPGTSLEELRKTIEEKNMTMTCSHYPLSVTHYRCIEQPEARECRLYYDLECLSTVEAGREDKCIYSGAVSNKNKLFKSLFTVFTFLLTFWWKI